eukprot:12931793-Prorocentrum_lima.AAC.1
MRFATGVVGGLSPPSSRSSCSSLGMIAPSSCVSTWRVVVVALPGLGPVRLVPVVIDHLATRRWGRELRDP